MARPKDSGGALLVRVGESSAADIRSDYFTQSISVYVFAFPGQVSGYIHAPELAFR
jgi:hypothetical protein